MDTVIVEFSPRDKSKVLGAIQPLGSVTGNYGLSELLLATSAPVKVVNRALTLACLAYPFYLRLKVD